MRGAASVDTRTAMHTRPSSITPAVFINPCGISIRDLGIYRPLWNIHQGPLQLFVSILFGANRIILYN